MTAIARDPVTISHRRLYATVELDACPERLNVEGERRVREALFAAIDGTTDIELTTPGRLHRPIYYSVGPDGGACWRIDRSLADRLAVELRRIAFDPECVEARR